MPMIMITGQKGILSSRQARFQIVDVVAAMRPLTKLSRQIVSADDDPDAGARRVPGGARRSARVRCTWNCLKISRPRSARRADDPAASGRARGQSRRRSIAPRR